ncbi:MAG: hypothetical protein NDJ94_20815 [Vicinamibacteria bacterium]|jgi:hypothetical protein|nr:hypothetical protein [Vicinamibacteria bacterium]
MRGLARVVLVAAVSLAAGADEASLATQALAGDVEAIRARGPSVMPRLVTLYERTAEPRQRATIAYVFYSLGWKSEAARAALMRDATTEHQALRLQVQWALGRVSDSPEVVDVLLHNMREDPSALFRDKAACALAYDQIHLGGPQKVRLFAGLIDALEDDTPQVRQIALQALVILTRQNKGFAANADPRVRAEAVGRWRAWLVELRANVS